MMQPKAVIRPTSVVEIPISNIPSEREIFIQESVCIQSILPRAQTVEQIQISNTRTENEDKQIQTKVIRTKNFQEFPIQNQPLSVSSLTSTTISISSQKPSDDQIQKKSLQQILRHKSTSVKCPQCYQQVMTKVEYEPNMTTHCLAFLLCIFLCWCCCFIPYCVKGSRNAHHSCPVCGVFLGLHEATLC